MNKHEILKYIKTKEDKMLCSNIIDKALEHKRKGITTVSNFLDKRELNLVIPILNKEKIEYTIFSPHSYCEKLNLVFGKQDNLDIICLKIISKNKLKHKDYLGTIFSLGIDRHIFGDILVEDNIAYLFVKAKIKDFIKNNLLIIKNEKVTIEEIEYKDIIIRNDKFIEYQINVASNRIDVILATLTNKSRSFIDKYINKGKVLLNYSLINNGSIKLKDNDIISIQGFGKYIYTTTEKITKKNKLIINIKKYK